MLLFIIIACCVVVYEDSIVSAGIICEGLYGYEVFSYQNYQIRVKLDTSKAKINIDACKSYGNKTLKQFDPGRMFQNATTAILRDVDWSILNTGTSKLTHVEMFNMIYFGDWSNCSQLDYLFVEKPKNNTVLSISPDWLINCTRMQRLKVRWLNITEIQHILQSAIYVQHLTLDSVTELPRLMEIPLFSTIRQTHRYLRHLFMDVRVTQNTSTRDYVTHDDMGQGHNSANLTWADVSAALVWQVSELSLESLSIYGPWFDLCAMGNFSSVKMESLKYLWLQNTYTAKLCFKKQLILPQLTEIGLYFNSLKFSPGFKLQVGQLFSVQSPQLVLDLNNRGQVSSFQFTRDDYLALSDNSNKQSEKSNLTLVGFRQFIKCGCTGGSWWFARAIRAGLVTAPGVFCDDHQPPKDLACEWIDCDRISCNSTCVCCQEGHGEIRVDCREVNLQSLSPELLHLSNLTRLIAPNNNITSLPDYFPDNLLWVDLSDNNIWHAGASKVEELFTQPARRVRLSRNYILCSCENKPLISTLQNKSQQIEDYGGITCAVTGTKLGNVDVSQLCASQEHDQALIKNRETILISVLSILVLAAVGVVLAFLLYLRRREIQIFLFARGWCLSCITEEDLDADRFYDVFISFCHEDTEFVLTELLPSLDRDYSVCIHLRDWCPGEMIPAHITRSVQQSRRTLVVMSRNFVRSSWGRLEFQTAHVSGVADGRVRVVMIILDDVLEKDQLAPELRSYVRLNTYMRWDDPWFWEKLRYALPHHRSPRPPLGQQQMNNVPCEALDGRIEMMAIEGPERSR